MKYSIIIPVYNRPHEVKELLESLTLQTYRNFEVLIVEDGSTDTCEEIVRDFDKALDVFYYFKQNSGPGLSRNFGAKRASGEYLIYLDSDCIIPASYLQTVHHSLSKDFADAFGGTDRAAANFTPIQKAISYSMTSFITTGGIRGGHKSLDKFHPRSFNMGYSKQVFLQTSGFANMRFGEDIDMSIRIFRNQFKVKLIEQAYVYHKRRTDFKKFYKQVFNSGLARINLHKKYPDTLKIVHLLPTAFTLGLLCLLLLSLVVDWRFITPVLLLALVITTDATVRNKSLFIGLLAVPASFIQLIGYGCGFLYAFWHTYVLNDQKAGAFSNTFYK